MKTIRKKIRTELSEQDRSVFSDENTLFFDIETTGFHRKYSIPYLIGCAYRHGDEVVFVQWFNDTGKDEEAMLNAFSSLLYKRKWSLFTFNGESFDIPYLEARYKLHGKKSPFAGLVSLDLYRMMRPFQQLYRIEHGSQKNWEQFLGICREDRYNGGELIDIYRQYLIEPDLENQELLLLHNEEDILGMLRLMPLLSYHAMLEDCALSLQKVEISSVTFPEFKDALRFSVLMPRVRIPRPLQVESLLGNLSVTEDRLVIDIPCVNATLRYYYPNYRDYYYLPAEDRAVHRSIGQYVDRKHRLAAKASTCYEKEENLFIPTPVAKKRFGIMIEEMKTKSIPDFRRYYRDTFRFIRLEDLYKEEDEVKSEYLHRLIKEISIASLEEE